MYNSSGLLWYLKLNQMGFQWNLSTSILNIFSSQLIVRNITDSFGLKSSSLNFVSSQLTREVLINSLVFRAHWIIIIMVHIMIIIIGKAPFSEMCHHVPIFCAKTGPDATTWGHCLASWALKVPLCIDSLSLLPSDVLSLDLICRQSPRMSYYIFSTLSN